MHQLSEKELSALNDLLSDEELLVKKFQMLASHADDSEIKQKFEQISRQHQGHFNALYEYVR
jgi:rubrerythrin